MKRTISFLCLSFLFVVSIHAQAFFKYEGFGKSNYRDKDNVKHESYKGSANVYRGGVIFPYQ